MYKKLEFFRAFISGAKIRLMRYDHHAMRYDRSVTRYAPQKSQRLGWLNMSGGG